MDKHLIGVRYQKLSGVCVLVVCLLMLGCVRGDADQNSSDAKTGQIGDVRGDGPPSNIDRQRLNLEDQVPQAVSLSATGNSPYLLGGRRFTPLKSAKGYVATGVASWYGKKFHGRRTSSGEPYDMYAMTAAHRILPLPSFVRVTNITNGKQAVVKVNDRGPFRQDRLIDLSYAAAVKLGADVDGTIDVHIEVLAVDASGSASMTDSLNSKGNIMPAGNDYRLYLQAGAFSDEDNAQSFREQLQQAGIQSVEIRPLNADGGVLHRVRIGPLDNQRSARQLLLQLAEQFSTNGRLVYQRIDYDLEPERPDK